ncbi:MAG TPA: hypothetical protein VFK52_05130 [Nocardioidaceae bacterium]|nr:hypothetical protein [Nocardioidaceae bacterium]
MRRALVPLVVLLLVAGCGGDGEADPTSHETMTIPTPAPDVDAAAKVAVEYVEAVRHHDAGAVYALAWSGLRDKETRAEFLARTKFGGVSDARISGVIEVGWDRKGRRLAIVPIIVTVSEAPQIGRVLLIREQGVWRYFDLAVPDQVPDLTAKRP